MPGAPSFRLINPQVNRSFIFKWEAFDLTTRWHFHPEVELIYFIDGKTTALIGDTFKEFKEGDLVLLGSNFPHVLQENKEYKVLCPGTKPFGLIIQFTPCFLGEEFLTKPEFMHINELLDKSKRGIHFKPAITRKVSSYLLQMHKQNDTEKLLNLLTVLNTLAQKNNFEYLTNQNYFFDYSQDEERMCKVNEFVYRYFTEKITIADVAKVANMTETAFCRYFKSRTLKQFTRFLNEVRIAYSCKLLLKKNYSITDVCFESGFNSLSYFNRQFKGIMRNSPKTYRDKKLS
jgi:AraC-like DNA-binding protein